LARHPGKEDPIYFLVGWGTGGRGAEALQTPEGERIIHQKKESTDSWGEVEPEKKDQESEGGCKRCLPSMTKDYSQERGKVLLCYDDGYYRPLERREPIPKPRGFLGGDTCASSREKCRKKKRCFYFRKKGREKSEKGPAKKKQKKKTRLIEGIDVPSHRG